MNEQANPELIGPLFESLARHTPHTAYVLRADVLNCPRCEAKLTEHLPDQRWRRHFECRECWMAFSFYRGRLQPGRDLNPEFLTKG